LETTKKAGYLFDNPAVQSLVRSEKNDGLKRKGKLLYYVIITKFFIFI